MTTSNVEAGMAGSYIKPGREDDGDDGDGLQSVPLFDLGDPQFG